MKNMILAFAFLLAAGCIMPEEADGLYDGNYVIETNTGHVFVVVDKQFSEAMGIWEYCIKSALATLPDDVVWVAEDELQEVVEANQ